MTALLASAWAAPLGGVMIGLASALYLFALGRVAGISGITGGLLGGRGGQASVGFMLGLLGAGLGLLMFAPQVFAVPEGRGLLSLALAGVLVGVGTRMGKGCTSGHGVSGIGRLSRRSLVATGVFMTTGFVVATLFQVVGV